MNTTFLNNEEYHSSSFWKKPTDVEYTLDSRKRHLRPAIVEVPLNDQKIEFEIKTLI